MKTYDRVYCSLTFFILFICMTVLVNKGSAAQLINVYSGRVLSTSNRVISPPTTINGQEVDVHALLIILGIGDDKSFRDSVLNNKDQMVKMLKRISYDCDIYTTIMESEGASEGTITKTAFAEGNERRTETPKKGIIRSQQVVEWLENLNPKPEDIVLVYYSGHGEIDAPSLLFSSGSNENDTLDRKTLSQKLEQKPARLRMLITDGSSFMEKKTGDSPDSTEGSVPKDPEPKLKLNGIVNLFFGHTGFLDIAAASQRTQHGRNVASSEAFFTSVFVAQVQGTMQDANKDYFISWEDAFTSVVYDMQEMVQSMVPMDDVRQHIPKAHSLPVPIRP